MKERPILFSAPMVQAILAGRKSQTRRVVKWKSPDPGLNLAFSGLTAGHYCTDEPSTGHVLYSRRGDGVWEQRTKPTFCPYGQPGDRLYVKEAAWMWCERRPDGTTETGRPKWHYLPLESAPVHYQADHPRKPEMDVVSPHTGNAWGWRLKVARFLPRWAVRVVLEVTAARPERLHSMTACDAIDEGAMTLPQRPGYDLECAEANARGEIQPIGDGPLQRFRRLWDTINGSGAWTLNPWVWRVEFRRLTR